MQVQLSTGVTLFLILGLTSLPVVIITITYANAQLDGFAGSAAVSAASAPQHHLLVVAAVVI